MYFSVIMSSFVIFRLTPPSPSGDDVIYEQPLKLHPSIGDCELLARAVVDVDEHQQHGEEAQRDGLPQKGQPSEKFVQCL